MMRGLSDKFYECFKEGYLNALIQRVRKDKDLDFQIREDSINIYYKGNSLLKLDADKKVTIAKKFTLGLDIPLYLDCEAATESFIKAIPLIKDNIIRYANESKKTLEAEYEQLLIRANNLEKRNASEYFIIDRQYQTGKENRFDLTGFFWDRDNREKGQTVPLTFLEVKFALNNDIKEVHEQIKRYYDYVKNHTSELAEEYEKVFKTKVELGLLNQDDNRMEALKTLNFSKNLNEYEFIIVLVDYNPNSTLLKEALNELRKLEFASQIRIFNAGFAMWKQNVKPIL
ncbi:MAG: hypothetical protein PWP31_808 [Clostridia bacterium]|nr:hypothetical protein [Clostridia bacterium]